MLFSNLCIIHLTQPPLFSSKYTHQPKYTFDIPRNLNSISNQTPFSISLILDSIFHKKTNKKQNPVSWTLIGLESVKHRSLFFSDSFRIAAPLFPSPPPSSLPLLFFFFILQLDWQPRQFKTFIQVAILSAFHPYIYIRLSITSHSLLTKTLFIYSPVSFYSSISIYLYKYIYVRIGIRFVFFIIYKTKNLYLNFRRVSTETETLHTHSRSSANIFYPAIHYVFSLVWGWDACIYFFYLDFFFFCCSVLCSTYSGSLAMASCPTSLKDAWNWHLFKLGQFSPPYQERLRKAYRMYGELGLEKKKKKKKAMRCVLTPQFSCYCIRAKVRKYHQAQIPPNKKAHLLLILNAFLLMVKKSFTLVFRKFSTKSISLWTSSNHNVPIVYSYLLFFSTSLDEENIHGAASFLRGRFRLTMGLLPEEEKRYNGKLEGHSDQSLQILHNKITRGKKN
ncbi:hypothetical protein VP01_591g1 [Puccinia sorghi]|uniref:Uncharacterized protein n=1 Tax=Puccinia sorghi TaxID=27349 RepID=A0A0L6UHR5_9BASI|nr:hypothetical protein VP01_591g1 [Puccinia sorghi]